MPQIAPKLKEQLLECGKWTEFVKYRQDLKEGGMSGADAHNAAIEYFFESMPEKTTASREERSDGVNKKVGQAAGGRPRKKKSAVKSPPKAAGRVLDGEESEAPHAGSSPSLPPGPAVKSHIGDMPSLVPVTSEDFGEKKASEVQVVRWVADNMQVVNPKPADCPCAAAWGLLAQCRGSMQARSDFWKLTYAKLLPTRAQMEQDKDALPDESKAKEVIEDLLKFGREARGEPGELEPIYETEGGKKFKLGEF